MKLCIRCFFITLLVIGCNNMKGPVSTEIVQVEAQTNHSVSIQSYEIPEGIFRGALWPKPDNENFQIWCIDGGKEIFYDINAPSHFRKYQNETTEDWSFKLVDSNAEKQIYVASNKDRSKIVTIELPVKKRKYNFSVLKNQDNNELIVFMDISETVRDKGLFGYVIINNNN